MTSAFFIEDVFLVIFFLDVLTVEVDAASFVSSFSSSSSLVVEDYYSCSVYFLSLFLESELKKSILGILISLALFKKAINWFWRALFYAF